MYVAFTDSGIRGTVGMGSTIEWLAVSSARGVLIAIACQHLKPRYRCMHRDLY